MDDEREPVTFERAVEMMGGGDRVHTIRSSAGIMLGCDWDRKSLLEAIKEHGAELAGPAATAMGHGLLLIDKTGPLFIETAATPEASTTD